MELKIHKTEIGTRQGFWEDFKNMIDKSIYWMNKIKILSKINLVHLKWVFKKNKDN